MPLHLHVNQKSDYDYEDDEKGVGGGIHKNFNIRFHLSYDAIILLE